jgi:hypothetical protein
VGVVEVVEEAGILRVETVLGRFKPFHFPMEQAANLIYLTAVVVAVVVLAVDMGEELLLKTTVELLEQMGPDLLVQQYQVNITVMVIL